jgi:hypothetical protein
VKFTCRMFDREGTERAVDVDSPHEAPDEYVHAHVRPSVGGVCFVEVVETRVLWRCEILSAAPLMLLSEPISAEAARAELAS